MARNLLLPTSLSCITDPAFLSPNRPHSPLPFPSTVAPARLQPLDSPFHRLRSRQTAALPAASRPNKRVCACFFPPSCHDCSFWRLRSFFFIHCVFVQKPDCWVRLREKNSIQNGRPEHHLAAPFLTMSRAGYDEGG